MISIYGLLDSLYDSPHFSTFSKSDQRFIENMKFKVHKTGYILSLKQNSRVDKIGDKNFGEEAYIMNNKEILKKSIKKAINKGYKPVKILGNALSDTTCHMLIIKDLYHAIIFSHEFAKAFWGEKAKEEQIMRYSDMIINEKNIMRWKYYLQEMILEKEPLKYLEDFL